MAKFIELYRIPWPWQEDEERVILQNVDDIAEVYKLGDHAVITLRRAAGFVGNASYSVVESYEEVKRMLIGGEAKRVPWEAD